MWLSEVLSSVPNTSLCTWFYVMFLVNCFVGLIMLIRVIHMLSTVKAGFGLGSLAFILTLISITISVVNGAFFYALCDRSLNKNSF